MQETANLKTALRKRLLTERQQLSPTEQHQKAQQLLQHFLTLPLFKSSHHIAGYWPTKGEMSSLPILEKAMHTDKQWYLPILDPSQERQLWFGEYLPEDLLTINRFGLLEPTLNPKKLLSPIDFDLVLFPLVAFDRFCQRLGMGKGYYDYTFSFLKNLSDPKIKRPFLLGLAYDLQEIEAVPTDAWDIALNGVLTESRYLSK
jgi:5-formyltetrahydrofolate cyclo-ligase